MKRTILAALIAASLAVSSGVPARQHCTTRSCLPTPAPIIAGQVAVATSDRLVMPRSPVISLRDCVGLPRWAALMVETLLRTWTPGHEGCTSGSCAPAPAPQVPSPMVVGRLV
jgi:hypothetical protein